MYDCLEVLGTLQAHPPTTRLTPRSQVEQNSVNIKMNKLSLHHSDNLTNNRLPPNV